MREQDFRRAARVVALKETEHRRLLAAQHPKWENRVTYWEIGDLDSATPAEALAAIEGHITALLDELAAARGG